MKYIKPALLVVNLRTVHMMAESLTINSGGESITSQEDILVKEQTNNTIWDNEW